MKVMEDRIRLAGMAYVVTEYKDVAEKMLVLSAERGDHSVKADIALHNAELIAHKWALLRDLPIGGTAAIENAQEDAGQYRDQHPDDVAEYLSKHQHVARRNGLS